MRVLLSLLGIVALMPLSLTLHSEASQKWTCGNGICEGNERSKCPQDCGQPAPECGNDICEGDEEITCPEDCTSSPPPAEEPDWELALPLYINDNWDVDGISSTQGFYEDIGAVALYSSYDDLIQDLEFDFVESVKSPDYRALAGKKTTLVLQFRANIFGHDNPAGHWVRFLLPGLSSDSGSTGCKFPDVSSGAPACMVELAEREHPLQNTSYDLYLRVGSDIRIERMKVGRLSSGILVFNIHYEGGDNSYDSLRCQCDVSIQRVSPTAWRTETSGSNLTCLEYDSQNNIILEAFNTEGEFKFTGVWRKLN